MFSPESTGIALGRYFNASSLTTAGPHQSVVRDPELRSVLSVLSFRKGTGPWLRP